MGAFDDNVEASRLPTSAYSMMDRGIGAARRKILLLILLGGFLFLSLLAFRRHDDIGSLVDTQRQSWANITIPSSITSDKTSAKSPTHHKVADEDEPDVEETSRFTEKKKEKPQAKLHSLAPGPHMGDRTLSNSSLLGVRNETLGVRASSIMCCIFLS